MKKMFLSAVAFAVVAVSAVAVVPTTSEAMPNFTRQTGASCLSCHFQAIPRLNAMGRNFRMNAYRDMGGDQALIEDDVLSLPMAFDASLMFKMKVKNDSSASHTTAHNTAHDTGTYGTNSKTAIQFPNEVALFIGGRLGENFGALAEVDLMNGGGMKTYNVAYVADTDFGLITAMGGSTGSLGASFVFKDPSNVLSRNTRASQNRSYALDTTINSGKVTGLGVGAYVNDFVWVAVGGVANAGGSAQVGDPRGASLTSLTPYLRAAVITDVAGLDTVAGFWYAKEKDANVDGAVAGTQYGLDLQMQGDLGDMSIGFYLPIILKSEQAGGVVAGGTAAQGNTTGYYPLVTAAFGHAGVRLGYDYSNNSNEASARKTTVVGAWYTIAQNVEIDLELESNAGYKSYNTTTLLFEYLY